MSANDTPTITPPPPADTIPPPPDYDALVDSPLVRREPPSPYAGLAEMVRAILAEIIAEEAPQTQLSRR